MTPKSFSVRIFLQDGTAEGVKIIARSKWSGRGLVIPRTSFVEERQRKELDAPGILLLVEPYGEGELPIITVEAANPVCQSLEHHYASNPLWILAYVFASKGDNLNQAQINYLETRLIELVHVANKARLASLQNSPQPAISTVEKDEAESFLAHMLSFLPLLGLNVFEPTVPA